MPVLEYHKVGDDNPLDRISTCQSIGFYLSHIVNKAFHKLVGTGGLRLSNPEAYDEWFSVLCLLQQTQYGPKRLSAALKNRKSINI